MVAQNATPLKKQNKNVAIAKKADRTAYDDGIAAEPIDR